MTTIPFNPPASTLEINARAAAVAKSTFSTKSLRDSHRTPFMFSMHGLQFRHFVLEQLVEPGLTVDGLWGGLEELHLKLQLRGNMCSEDWKKKKVYEEWLQECGLSYEQARPEWDLEHFGVLQLVDPVALVKRFPALSPWEPEQYLFSLFRIRSHGG